MGADRSCTIELSRPLTEYVLLATGTTRTCSFVLSVVSVGLSVSRILSTATVGPQVARQGGRTALSLSLSVCVSLSLCFGGVHLATTPTNMQHAHPLAIIPLSQQSDSSSRDSSRSGSPVRAEHVAMRALIPRPQPVQGNSAAIEGQSLRSEDDTALMRSLISLLPHEQADSQVCVLCCLCHVAHFRLLGIRCSRCRRLPLRLAAGVRSREERGA